MHFEVHASDVLVPSMIELDCPRRLHSTFLIRTETQKKMSGKWGAAPGTGGIVYTRPEGKRSSHPKKAPKARVDSTPAQQNTEVTDDGPRVLYTCGYGGWKLEEFLEKLQDARITCLVDVRISPFCTYDRSFNGKELQKHLEEVGVGYLHAQELGNVFHTLEDKKDRVESYRALIYASGLLLSKRLRPMVERGQKCAIMCACGKRSECHRGIIAGWTEDALSWRTQELCG